MALIWHLLPHMVAKQRSLPFIVRVTPEVKVHCHALAVAKKYEESYETVVLAGDNGKRRAEHLKLARVTSSKWVVHPGTALSTSLMFITDIPDDCSQNKRHKLNKAVVVDKIEPIKNQDALSKLFAVAHLLAEVKKAKIEKREVDTDVAHGHFDKCVPQPKIPKQVFVLWNDGCEERVNEVSFSSLFHQRI